MMHCYLLVTLIVCYIPIQSIICHSHIKQHSYNVAVVLLLEVFENFLYKFV